MRILADAKEKRIGLILSGGGARAAYQVGVLRAIANILPKHAKNPFHIIAGTSAGALNAVSIATHAQHFRTGVRTLEYIWKNISSEQIYNPQSGNLLSSASSVLLSMLSGKSSGNAVALLDNEPLAALKPWIDSGTIKAHWSLFGTRIDKASLIDAIMSELPVASLADFSLSKDFKAATNISEPFLEFFEKLERLGLEWRIGSDWIPGFPAIRTRIGNFTCCPIVAVDSGVGLHWRESAERLRLSLRTAQAIADATDNKLTTATQRRYRKRLLKACGLEPVDA